MFRRYLSAHHVLVSHLHIAVIVEFTQNPFTGSEDSQTATVTLQLTATSAVVPTGGFTVLLSSAPGSATGRCECGCGCVCACACACVCVHACVRVYLRGVCVSVF